MDLPADVRSASTPAAAAKLRAAVAPVEGEELLAADSTASRSLEALRLGDPAAMSGCWNPGCAAALAMAGWQRELDGLPSGMHLYIYLVQPAVCSDILTT